MELSNLTLGSKIRTMLVTDIYMEQLETGIKIVFTVFDETNKETFKISDAYVDHPKKGVTIKALYLVLENKTEIVRDCTLGRIMQYYSTDSLLSMLNTNIKVAPDPKNYLVLVATDNL